jgi:FkbM family methyltransferase
MTHMLFPNVRRIMGIGSPISSLKLILAVATSSRPKYRGVFLRLLQPFVRNGELTLSYRCYERVNKTTVRMSDLQADCLSTLELGVSDTYQVERNFRPELVIDGGGNIGLFTLRAVASIPPGTETQVKFVICEPLPRNIDQIHKHLEMNGIDAELMPFCLGGTRRSVPFYCRAANESSFDSHEAYDRVIEIPVITLEDAIGTSPAERILIKLDIEGMEMEVLSAYLPGEQRAVYIVGELHHYPLNAPIFERMFQDHGWTLELFDIGGEESSFRACSPAAVPLLKWPAFVKSPTQVGDEVGSR